MSGKDNLEYVDLTEGQRGKATSTNVRAERISAALTENLIVAMADGNQTPTKASCLACMTIECTGALTADRDLVLPTNRKLYFIENKTTGGFKIRAKCSGQTGFLIDNGTYAIARSNGTDIVLIATGSVTASGVVNTGAFSSRGAAGTSGRIFLPSDGYSLARDSGSAWVPWGPLFPLTKPPASSSFTWVNQGSATVTEEKDAIVLRSTTTSGSPNLRARTIAAPATPYTITALLQPGTIVKGNHSFGLLWRDSSGGGLVVFDLYTDGTDLVLRVSKYTSPTVFSADYQAISAWTPWWPMFLRIADNGTNRICSYSGDGQNFVQFHSVGRTDFITPDEIGFHINSESSGTPHLDMATTLLSWKQG